MSNIFGNDSQDITLPTSNFLNTASNLEEAILLLDDQLKIRNTSQLNLTEPLTSVINDIQTQITDLRDGVDTNIFNQIQDLQNNKVDISTLEDYRTITDQTDIDIAQDIVINSKYPNSNPNGYITNSALTSYRTSALEDIINSNTNTRIDNLQDNQIAATDIISGPLKPTKFFILQTNDIFKSGDDEIIYSDIVVKNTTNAYLSISFIDNGNRYFMYIYNSTIVKIINEDFNNPIIITTPEDFTKIIHDNGKVYATFFSDLYRINFITNTVTLIQSLLYSIIDIQRNVMITEFAVLKSNDDFITYTLPYNDENVQLFGGYVAANGNIELYTTDTFIRSANGLFTDITTQEMLGNPLNTEIKVVECSTGYGWINQASNVQVYINNNSSIFTRGDIYQQNAFFGFSNIYANADKIIVVSPNFEIKYSVILGQEVQNAPNTYTPMYLFGTNYQALTQTNLSIIINGITCNNLQDAIRTLKTFTSQKADTTALNNYATTSNLSVYRTSTNQDIIDSDKYPLSSNPNGYISASSLTPYELTTSVNTKLLNYTKFETIILSSLSGSPSAGTSYVFSIWSTTRRQFLIPRNCEIINLFVNCRTNTGATGSCVFTLEKNTIVTAMTATLGSAPNNITSISTASPISFVAGDQYSIWCNRITVTVTDLTVSVLIKYI